MNKPPRPPSSTPERNFEMKNATELMTEAELIKDAARLTAEVKKLRAIGAEAEARFVQAELTTVADRLGWNK